MSETKILQWETECWKCGEGTHVMWPKENHLNGEIGEELAESDDNNVERVYSNTQDREVWGNVCEHCDAYQGNHYIEQEALTQNPPMVECKVCGDEHEWYPDKGLGGAFNQGWIDCPEYGPVSVSDPRDSNFE